MSENKFNLCPGCGRHCSLNDPGCERGEALAHGGGMTRPGRPLYEDLDTDGKLLWTLRSLGRFLHEFHEGRASQGRILGLLSESPSVTQRALTERLGVQPGTASEVFGKLESAGLIERAPSESDRRTWDLRLTERGREAARSAGEERRQRRMELFRCFNDDQREQLLGLLEALDADWQERYGRPHGPRRPDSKGIHYIEGKVHALPHHPRRDGEESPKPRHPGHGEGMVRPMPHHPGRNPEDGAVRTLPHRPRGGDGPKPI